MLKWEIGLDWESTILQGINSSEAVIKENDDGKEEDDDEKNFCGFESEECEYVCGCIPGWWDADGWYWQLGGAWVCEFEVEW